MDDVAIREAFEAWAISKKCPPELLEIGGDYGGSGVIAGQWAAWQAASDWTLDTRQDP